MGAVEGGLAVGLDLVGGAEVDRGGGVERDPGMAMVMVVGGEETLAVGAGIGQRPEPVRKIMTVLESLKLSFRKRISVS
nr:hypothetical protein [Frankia gtarii]